MITGRVAVLGAPGTAPEALRQQLQALLKNQSGLQFVADAQAASTHDFALLMGLPPLASSLCQDADSTLRQQLHAVGIPYRVVFGSGAECLTNALLALGLPPSDDKLQSARELAQFDLNQGRTPWSCEKCSDPACEHRLFTGLLQGL